MKSIILIVEDARVSLLNIKLLLEVNNYQVITATHGKNALKVLKSLSDIPDLIISDIMMPIMDGYDFFKAVSNNPLWNRIPFLFLSALSSPGDVRLGKMLGVDDYLTKPFKDKDLLASISGKISRHKKIKTINKKIDDLISTINIDDITSTSKNKGQIALLVVLWDDQIGPNLKYSYPNDDSLDYSLNEVGQQLFHATVSIYGYDDVSKAEGILLNIKNINKIGYIYFDSYPDSTVRAKERQYMIGVIAPSINYLESLRIKEILREISLCIKKKKEWDIKIYREKVSDVLLTDLV